MDLKITIAVALIVTALKLLQLTECARKIDAKERAKETLRKRSILHTKRAIEEEDLSPNELLDLSDRETMTVTKSIKTSQGVRVERLQETYDGVEVLDSSVVVEINKDGKLTGDASGTLIQGIEDDLQSVTPSISVEQALQIAIDSEDDINYEVIRKQSSLQIQLDKGDRARLVYFLQYFVIKNNVPKQPAFFIDAMNGDILKKWNNLNAHKCEYGITAVGGNEEIGKIHYGEAPFCLDMLTDGDICYLENKYVRVIDMNGTTDDTYNETVSFNCTEGYNDSINGAYSPAMDAFFHGTVAGKLFEEWFQTTPLPEKIKIRVHFGPNIPAAFWGDDTCTIGDGGTLFFPLVSLDIICHEIGHGITLQSSGLFYFDQSGGINEAFSDILGETCEDFLQETDFVAGQGYRRNKERNYERSYENPPIDGHSIRHVDDFQPGMNTHYSSGIFNRVFFVLIKQKGLDIQQVFKVFYHANQIYWHHLSSFQDAACGLLRSAYDLGQKPTEYVRALQDVGITKCDLSKHIRSLVFNRTYDEITVSVESEPMFAYESPGSVMSTIIINAQSSNGNVGIKYIIGSRNTTDYNFDDNIPLSMNTVEISTTKNDTSTVVYFSLTTPNGQFMDDVSVIVIQKPVKK